MGAPFQWRLRGLYANCVAVKVSKIDMCVQGRFRLLIPPGCLTPYLPQLCTPCSAALSHLTRIGAPAPKSTRYLGVAFEVPALGFLDR